MFLSCAALRSGNFPVFSPAVSRSVADGSRPSERCQNVWWKIKTTALPPVAESNGRDFVSPAAFDGIRTFGQTDFGRFAPEPIVLRKIQQALFQAQ